MVGVRMQLQIGGGKRDFFHAFDDAKRKTLTAFAKATQVETRHRIAVSKTTPGGSKWVPWKFSTLRARNRKGNASRGLLYDTGALWNSIQYKQIGKNKIEIGSTVVYAKWLQKGTTKMSGRRILNINTKQSKILFRKLFKENMV
jgi:hypothetical protein